MQQAYPAIPAYSLPAWTMASGGAGLEMYSSLQIAAMSMGPVVTDPAPCAPQPKQHPTLRSKQQEGGASNPSADNSAPAQVKELGASLVAGPTPEQPTHPLANPAGERNSHSSLFAACTAPL